MLDIYSLINRKIIFPLYYWKNKDPRLAYLRQLDRQQYWSKESLESLQLTRLQEIVKYAFDHTQYYRRVMTERGLTPASIKSLKDIEKLPVLTKQIIQNHGDELISDEYKKSELIKDASGGSTGKPTEYYKDLNRHNIRRADIIRHDRWSGWNIGERSALIWGAQRDLKSLQSFKEFILSRYVARIWELDAFSMTPQNMDGFVEELIKIKPSMILGYANALYVFAQYMIEYHPNHKIKLKGIISSAETLTEKKRTTIEKAFNCKVLNRYGSREVGLIASECKQQSGLHINADNVLVEVLSGEHPMPQGERGDIVVTDFLNKGMPFIRYKLEDVGYLSVDQCQCGITLPLLGAVEGRTGDFFVGKDNTMIHGEYFTHLFYGISEVKQFQIIQHTLLDVELKIASDAPDSKEYLSVIIEKIKSMLGEKVIVEVKFVESIPTPASGKSLFTISKVTPNYRDVNK
jgi:phenylacetate-CoA ligase